ncbi:hypothetical protein J3R30DRAFT_3433086 [Lentinula aciculospora]|uniref:ER transporter 6TM N-terminal domain-containing protein n=1 Tax=Lentinula aciculospora TaxID=153920 RepID=A0A9W9AT00_9AGAR|nr:hypothetical protein J3R30DRAFT_3433086 [Lentinula aciculospora]
MAEHNEKKELSSNDASASGTKQQSTAGKSGTGAGEPQSKLKTLLAHLPLWVSSNLTKPRSLKTLLRCWLASWVGFIIILPDASLNVLGSAGFFAMLCSFFLPPNLPVQLFCFLMLTLVVGLCFSWGIGVAAMRAANAVRSTAHIQAVALQIQQSIKSNPAFQADPTLALTTAVYNGEFLETRASVIYGCFLGFFAFIYGLIRAYIPVLTFTSIFATIGLDIFCSFGPLLPTAQYTLLKTFLISVGCYTGIALVTTLFVFPETMSHSALRTVCEQLDRVEKFVMMQGEVLKAVDQESGPAGTGTSGNTLLTKLDGIKTLMVVIMRQLNATSGMISLEFSHGKWSSDDVKDLVNPLRGIVARSLGLESFSKLVRRSTEIMRENENLSKESSNNTAASPHTSNQTSASPKNLPDTYNDAHLLRQMATHTLQYENTHRLRILDILPLVESATFELRKAVVAAVAATRKSLDNVNRHRWTRHPDVDAELTRELDAAYESLTMALKEFTQDNQNAKRMHFIKPFLALLQKEDGTMLTKAEQEALPFRSLFIAFVLGTNLVSLSEAVIAMMNIVRSTIAKRQRNRLWAPKGLRKIGKLLKGAGGSGEEADAGQVFGEDAIPTKSEEEEDAETGNNHKRDPDSRPPTNILQKMMNKLHSLYQWCGTPEAKFAFKYAFISIATWIPAVVNNTANFYYEEKGLWALIMAQTTLNIYASDQVFNLVIRLVGTFVGAVLGLAAWYIGDGNGVGNPYGAAAVTAVFMLPLLFVRNFAPQRFLPGVLLGCATFALVIGYSWVDGHVPQSPSPGIGWSIAWKRFTLVIIGSTAAFIMMMLPPTSGRKAVRYRNASIITGLGNLYSFLMSTWMSDAPLSNKALQLEFDSSSKADADKGNRETIDDEKTEKLDTATTFSPHYSLYSVRWLDKFRVRLLSLSDELTSLKQLTTTATWEGSIRGKWPAEEYNALLDAEGEMLVGLALLGGALAHLNDESRMAFMHNTRVLNPNLIADVMTAFSLISQSLRTGEPLHQVLPQSLVGRLLYHHYNHHHLHEVSPNRAHGGDGLTVEMLSSLDYMFYATGIVAVFLVLKSVDDLQKITKRLCGEVPFEGFEKWRRQFESEHTTTQ